MKITEDQIIAQLQAFLTECDADELARLTGEIFGGKCFFMPEESGKDYDFEPDENYMGAFGYLYEETEFNSSNSPLPLYPFGENENA